MEGNAKMYQNLFMNSLDSGPESRYLIPSADFGLIKALQPSGEFLRSLWKFIAEGMECADRRIKKAKRSAKAERSRS